ncbi:YdcF family protein [Hoyosella rhizosphaerae]|uniref:DUF218 domain-containing protein n=1 Tax=Hoyosella rhizosphaerae TaxID=1755582 RepID=A0A916UAS0_9ACTN|nr:YdcF family protein [Hoyosella rhizosphaerae]MBN4926021.1 YdcF family protein [Hoyosella rhizosphaerae]GGC66161.1 hypothetical protein GCM10011410_18420 [Hoyosella rhizosphaerae]
MFNVVATIVLLLLFRHFWQRDRRQLRNGFLLFGAVWFGISAIIEITSVLFPPVGVVWFLSILLLPVTAVVFVGFLLFNGVVMVRREGRSLGNLLSFLTGLILLALPVAGVLLTLTLQPVLVGIAVFLFLTSVYLAVFFVVFIGYAYFYDRASRNLAAANIVILGSGLLNGEVPPLLRRRLDRALQVWKAPQNDERPLLIPSGGQGPDEPRPEGVAMAEYLLSKGVPEQLIAVEDQARNTHENVKLSQRIIVERGKPGPTVIVTSNYHGLRAALIAREVGISAEVAGAHTATYFLPSAILREFIAILVCRSKINVIALAGFVFASLMVTLIFAAVQ